MAVGPGPLLPALGFGMLGIRPVNPLPVREAKIHGPLLRPDTLARVRLNRWLDRAARGRLAVIVGDAGFGKTTLLADWSSRSKRKTAWYRLEHDDRDWLTFIRHLVAAGRQVEPGFAPGTYRLLCQLGPGGPTQAELTAALAREMAEFGAADSHGFSVILDDFHSIELSEETDPVIAAMLEATGPGFSLILAARTEPELPPVRLRGRNAVNQIEDHELRFTAAETEALFNEAYGIPLEAEVAVELAGRTQGWAALLSLVRTRLEEEPSPDPRALVAHLSATEGDLYDFLAEEVLVDLPAALASVLTRLAILGEVTVEGAAIVAADVPDLEGQIMAAERVGLLHRVAGSNRWAFAALIRDFLASRLEQLHGRRFVRSLHLDVAKHFDGEDWFVAAGHYVLGGRPEEAERLVARSIEDVLGSGGYRAALDLLADSAETSVSASILRARSLLQLGASQPALVAAEQAVAAARSMVGPDLATALRSAASVAIGVHEYGIASEYAKEAVAAARAPADRRLAETQLDLVAIGGTGNLPALALRLEQLLVSHQRSRKTHYEAISSLNLALVYLWLDRAPEALRLCLRADELFERSSRGYERVSAILARANAEALLGRWREAEQLVNVALGVEHPEGNAEAVLEAAWVAAWFGPEGRASELLSRVQVDRLPEGWRAHWRVVQLWVARESQEIDILLPRLLGEPTISFEAGSAFRWHLARARALAETSRLEEASRALHQAAEVAVAQASPVERRLVELQSALLGGARVVSPLVASWPADGDPILGVFALELSRMLGELAPEAADVVARAARSNPERWRSYLRAPVATGSTASVSRTAALLGEIGEAEDVARLREATRRLKRHGDNWGDVLSRRLAPRVWIEDLGLATIKVGDRPIDGRSIRRKALALLLFLLGQPNGAATPDQLIDALWPEQDPEPALNSVHQTIYVLRRVFEPDYRAGASPEYLHFDSDMVWLDPELVDSRSWRCLRLLSNREWEVERVNELVATYSGRFAADFMYEEWASPLRDRLHALYLATAEQAVAGRIGSGGTRWRLWVGQQALLVDPEADSIEAQVIGLYRAVEATAAAREQYAHYAMTMREQLGIEPPRFEDL